MNQRLLLTIATFFTITLSSCEVVGGIFKAGMYWAFFLVALVIAIILYFVFKARK